MLPVKCNELMKTSKIVRIFENLWRFLEGEFDCLLQNQMTVKLGTWDALNKSIWKM